MAQVWTCEPIIGIMGGTMPTKAELDRRGGLVRVRTVRLPDGRYRRIYVVRGKGKRGGHTIAGEAKRRKGAR